MEYGNSDHQAWWHVNNLVVEKYYIHKIVVLFQDV